jgi:hypothetical protein
MLSVLHGGEARGPIKRYHIGYVNEERFSWSLNIDSVVNHMIDEMHFIVAAVARTRVFLHSGVVAFKGQAILIPGQSESGKSTLVTEFLKAGATLYSDEYAVIDRRGFVHPFPRPIQLRDKRGGETRHDPQTMGVPVGIKPLPVGLVLLSKYDPKAHWNPRPVSSGQAALRLMRHALTVRREPKAVLQLLTRLSSQARVLKGPRGQAIEVVDWYQKNL